MTTATSRNEQFLAKWHPLVAARDVAALEEILAEDVTMGAPPYWDRLSGRPLVHHLLGLVINTIDDFTYHREWQIDSQGNGEIALEFHGHIGEMTLQGMDLITINDRGQLTNLDVMIRPMNSLEALRDIIAPKMMEFVQQQMG